MHITAYDTEIYIARFGLYPYYLIREEISMEEFIEQVKRFLIGLGTTVLVWSMIITGAYLFVDLTFMFLRLFASSDDLLGRVVINVSKLIHVGWIFIVCLIVCSLAIYGLKAMERRNRW